MTIRQVLRRYLQHVIAMIAMVGLALAVALYVSVHERLRFPWQHQTRIFAEFENAQAVTAGQGQTVDVAGVKVGEIGGVRLENGRALVELDIQSSVPGGMYRNAHLQLRPKTGLNDMAVEMDPGTPDPSLPDRGRLHDGDRLPIESTRPNVNPDQVLASLDSDTRQFLEVFVNAGATGLRGRGADLRAVLKATQPTFQQSTRIARAVADRRAKVRRLISNLRLLAHATGSKDRELASLVGSSSTVFGTLARRDADLQSAIGQLPGALAATRNALVATHGLALDARPALARLLPVADQLAPALVEARPLLRDATPVVRDDVRPLVREAIPLFQRLGPSVRLIDHVTPGLIDAGRALNHVVNELAYNPPGSEEGYLFWLPWFTHNSNSSLSIGDAHGAAFRGLVLFGCSTVGQLVTVVPPLQPILSLPVCPASSMARRPKAGSPAKLAHDARVQGKPLGGLQPRSLPIPSTPPGIPSPNLPVPRLPKGLGH